jgi:transcriptional regulator with XRE-family HTH domain
MHGERIRAAREKRRWSRDQLATAAGITTDLLGKYERNAAIPSLGNLEKLAAAMGMPEGDLLPNSGDDPANISLAAIAAELDPLPRADLPEAIAHLAAQARLLVAWRLRTPLAAAMPLIRHVSASDDDLGERPGTVPSGRDRR